MTPGEWVMAVFCSAVLTAGSVHEYGRGHSSVAGILTGVAIFYWITIWITS